MTNPIEPRVRKVTTSVKLRNYTHWMVDYGIVNGKRKRSKYRSEAAANRAVKKWKVSQEREVEKQEILATRIGEKAEKLSTGDLLDAVKALEILEQSTVSLATAAEFYVSHNTPQGGQKSAEDLYDGYLLSRKLANRRPDTLRDIRSYLKCFADDFGDDLPPIVIPFILQVSQGWPPDGEPRGTNPGAVQPATGATGVDRARRARLHPVINALTRPRTSHRLTAAPRVRPRTLRSR
jgi:hypothetical protein